MLKYIFCVLLALAIPTSAFADYTLVVPQKPGAGTSQWAAIVAKELGKFTDEPIKIRHIPGARDIPGFDKFHEELRFDDKTIMVSHGGNGVAFLQEEVKYNYIDYDSIGLMNLNIIAGKTKGSDFDIDKVKFAAGSGMVPEGLAMTMLLCGKMSLPEYVRCFKKHVIWVKGMSGSERRLAFRRGELNGSRENPAAYKKHIAPNDKAEIWFHHGILQPDGTKSDDPNHPGFQFEDLYEKKWGEKPSGELYDAYKLVQSFRDGMQKALWVNKGNPNTEKLRKALTEMANNPESVAAIQKKVGVYEWKIGQKGNEHRDILMGFINADALETLVRFNIEAFGLASKYKKELLGLVLKL